MSEFSPGLYGQPTPEEPAKGRRVAGTALGVAAVAGLALTMSAASCGEDTPNAAPVPSASAAPSPSPSESYAVKGETDIDRACSMLLDQAINKPVTTQDIKRGIKDVKLRNTSLRIFGLQQASDVMLGAVADTNEPAETISAWKAISIPSLKQETGKAVIQDAISDMALMTGSGYGTTKYAQDARTIIIGIGGKNAKELKTVTRLEALERELDKSDYGSPQHEKKRKEVDAIDDKAEEAFRTFADKVDLEYSTKRNPICDKSPEWQKVLKDGEKARAAEEKACEPLAEPARDDCEAGKAIELITNDSIYEPDAANEWTVQVSPDNTEQQARIDAAEADKAIGYVEGGYDGLSLPWAQQVANAYDARRVDIAEADQAIKYVEGGHDSLGFPFADAVANPTERKRVDQAFYSYVARLNAEGNGILGADVIDHISDKSMRDTLRLTYPN